MIFKIIRSFILLFSMIWMISCSTTKTNSADDIDDNRKIQTAKINVQLGIAYLQQNNIQRAKQKLLTALDEAPNIPETWYSMAYYLEATGNKVEAQNYYLKAIDVAPKRGDVQNNYGTFLCRSGSYAASIQHFALAVKDPAYLDAADAYENAALCSLKMHDDANAEKFFQQALLQDPMRASSAIELAELNYKTGDYLQAKDRLKQFLQISPATPQSVALSMKLEKQLSKMNTNKFANHTSQSKLKSFVTTQVVDNNEAVTEEVIGEEPAMKKPKVYSQAVINKFSEENNPAESKDELIKNLPRKEPIKDVPAPKAVPKPMVRKVATQTIIESPIEHTAPLPMQRTQDLMKREARNGIENARFSTMSTKPRYASIEKKMLATSDRVSDASEKTVIIGEHSIEYEALSVKENPAKLEKAVMTKNVRPISSKQISQEYNVRNEERKIHSDVATKLTTPKPIPQPTAEEYDDSLVNQISDQKIVKKVALVKDITVPRVSIKNPTTKIAPKSIAYKNNIEEYDDNLVNAISEKPTHKIHISSRQSEEEKKPTIVSSIKVKLSSKSSIATHKSAASLAEEYDDLLVNNLSPIKIEKKTSKSLHLGARSHEPIHKVKIKVATKSTSSIKYKVAKSEVKKMLQFKNNNLA